MAVRTPMTPRAQAWAGLLGLAMLLALLRPVSRPVDIPAPSLPGLRLLAEGAPWLDRARLADPATVILPPLRTTPFGPEAAVPEAMPFPPVAPDLRSSPEGTWKLPITRVDEVGTSPTSLPELVQPLMTLGERVARALPPPRTVCIRATATDSSALFEREVEDEIFKTLPINILKNKPHPIFSVAIDAFGQQGSPVLLEGTGDRALDQTLINWASRQPWASWLPPGAYRVEIAP